MVGGTIRTERLPGWATIWPLVGLTMTEVAEKTRQRDAVLGARLDEALA